MREPVPFPEIPIEGRPLPAAVKDGLSEMVRPVVKRFSAKTPMYAQLHLQDNVVVGVVIDDVGARGDRRVFGQVEPWTLESAQARLRAVSGSAASLGETSAAFLNAMAEALRAIASGERNAREIARQTLVHMGETFNANED